MPSVPAPVAALEGTVSATAVVLPGTVGPALSWTERQDRSSRDQGRNVQDGVRRRRKRRTARSVEFRGDREAGGGLEHTRSSGVIEGNSVSTACGLALMAGEISMAKGDGNSVARWTQVATRMRSRRDTDRSGNCRCCPPHHRRILRTDFSSRRRRRRSTARRRAAFGAVSLRAAYVSQVQLTRMGGTSLVVVRRSTNGRSEIAAVM